MQRGPVGPPGPPELSALIAQARGSYASAIGHNYLKIVARLKMFNPAAHRGGVRAPHQPARSRGRPPGSSRLPVSPRGSGVTSAGGAERVGPGSGGSNIWPSVPAMWTFPDCSGRLRSSRPNHATDADAAGRKEAAAAGRRGGAPEHAPVGAEVDDRVHHPPPQPQRQPDTDHHPVLPRCRPQLLQELPVQWLGLARHPPDVAVVPLKRDLGEADPAGPGRRGLRDRGYHTFTVGARFAEGRAKVHQRHAHRPHRCCAILQVPLLWWAK